MITRTATELNTLETFEERFDYLMLAGRVGNDTFGFERYLNQRFYRSKEWRDIRHHVIARDEACDLGIEGYDIFDRPIIHHMNPMTAEQVIDGISDILDPEYLITTTHRTHNAIHYGTKDSLPQPLVTRTPGDTRPW